jgi:hypothetical protein
MALLSNALAQGIPGNKSALQASEWKEALTAKLESLNYEALQADVEPFLERRADSTVLNEFALRAAISKQI